MASRDPVSRIAPDHHEFPLAALLSAFAVFGVLALAMYYGLQYYRKESSTCKVTLERAKETIAAQNEAAYADSVAKLGSPAPAPARALPQESVTV